MSPGRGSGMLMDRKLCAEGDRPLQPSHLNTERSEGAMDRARVDRKEAATRKPGRAAVSPGVRQQAAGAQQQDDLQAVSHRGSWTHAEHQN